ncbi:MAG: hypothetical protein B6D39_07730 [Anaerolineae bacterium UTCFX2]|jgi:uncharacterized membrane protein|nr:VWA domain-containing protein [Anaerolineae bacterium]MCZ7553889.1 VWA domain-containing protein [Anaerolineales bacterium]OQY90853.1 MAG: hypothetical protein B6D39_07730 [Anaerolineae bacterium UTCFX2]
MAALDQIVSHWQLLAALLAALALLTWFARKARLKWLLAWVLRVCLVLIAWAGLFYASRSKPADAFAPQTVMLLDLSDSIDGDNREAAWRSAREWQMAAENRVLSVYGNSSVFIMPEEDGALDTILEKTNPKSSDLAGALQKVERLFDSRLAGIILATDGLVERADQIDQMLTASKEAGARLDAVPISPRNQANDLAVADVLAPRSLWAGTAFDVFVPVQGETSESTPVFELFVNGESLAVSSTQVGSGLYRIPLSKVPEGIVMLKVVGRNASESDESGSQFDSDPFLENNQAFAAIQVFPPPNVLYVTSNPNSAPVQRMQRLLSDQNIQVTQIQPAAFPTNLAQLRQFGVIFIDNLLSNQLNQEQQIALQVFASEFAGGVVFLGGQNSYTLGGYQNSILEPMLPVKLEPPARSLRQPITFLLILDLSGSMNVRNQDDISSISLAIEAAMRSIETLQVDDYLGILTFSDAFQWAFPLQRLTGPEEIQQALDTVNRMEASGTTYMYAAMREGVLTMAGVPADAPHNKHILLLSDGQSTDGTPDEFLSLAGLVPANGITLSTIALGLEADKGLLEQLAEVGKGRFYAVENVEKLPYIMIAESQAARSENIQTGVSGLKALDSSHPILSGLSRESLPELQGYNALSSRKEEGAEDILVSTSFEDPILSVWQYGLGRVIAWTTDNGAEWLGAWEDEPQSKFWSQVVRYALADPASSAAQVDVQVDPEKMIIQASLFTTDGKPVNLAEVTFSYLDQSQTVRKFSLVQQGIGAYRTELARPPEGEYRAVLAYQDAGGERYESAVPFAVNPPDEWLPADPQAGFTNLQRWTELTGGQFTTFDELLQQTQSAADENSSASPRDFTWYILAALLVLWPLEIAIRRRWLPWM